MKVICKINLFFKVRKLQFLVLSTIGSLDFGSFRVFLALICAICGLFTPKVEVLG